VRLGGNEFAANILIGAMDRAVLVCARFAAMPAQRAKEIVAVATSATREAENQREFLRRLRAKRYRGAVISGRRRPG